MISIVVCSVNESYFSLLTENISATIGVPYEIIRLDNSNNQYSICSAYNEGAIRARFEYICFAHEDILIRTQDWGKTVVGIFESNVRVGILGIAGTSYKSAVPSGWAESDERNYINIVQHYRHSNQQASLVYINPANRPLVKAVCIDGVWMCSKRKIVTEIRFDEDTFKGFHCYDMDFSLSVYQHYDLAVSFEIVIEHFSEGRYDLSWIADTLKLHSKWKDKLPASTDTVSPEVQRKAETATLTGFFYNMVYLGYPVKPTITMLTDKMQNRFVYPKELMKLRLALIKHSIKICLKKIFFPGQSHDSM